MSELILRLDAFVRSVGVERATPHAIFLGAGASISSGVPSADQCLWKWKQSIFLTNNPGVERQFQELSLPSVRERIQRWLDDQGAFPAAGDLSEYSFYAEYCYPRPESRRRFFEEQGRGVRPHIGYRLLCLLAGAGLVKSVWTTNFDGLVARAAALAGMTAVEVGLDSVARVRRVPQAGELVCVALHGDYRYDALKNTSEEPRTQEATLSGELVHCLRDTPLIVLGYSGRDDSIMETLRRAYAAPGPGCLFWCGFGELDTGGPVEGLLRAACAAGREAYYVPGCAFDDVLLRLALHVLDGPPLEQARSLVEAAASASLSDAAPFRIPPGPVVGLIKSNAFPIECPSELYQCEVEGEGGPGTWRRLRELCRGRDFVAAPLKGNIMSIGDLDSVKDAFGPTLRGEVTRIPIAERELGMEDGVVIHLLRGALVRALASSAGLETDGEDLLWLPDASGWATVHGRACRVHDAALVFLRRLGRRQYLVLKPTVVGFGPQGEPLVPEDEQELRRQKLTKQYNRQFNDAVNAWRSRLFGAATTRVEFPRGRGSSFRFVVSRAPAFARVQGGPSARPISVPAAAERHVAHDGVIYEEPKLLFTARAGDRLVPDFHPIRGVVENRPYDFPLTQRGFASDIGLGIVCPARDAQGFNRYLASLLGPAPVDSKAEYLLDYPGFARAFGVPLTVPGPGSAAWADCREPEPASGSGEGVLEAARTICRAIDGLKAAADPTVVAVFVPDRWRRWERSGPGEGSLDLRRFVKAYCIQRGISTQFVRESTPNKSYRCEILWWLALSFYVKAMRTPWILEAAERDTAYVGLGFCIDQSARDGGRVVLGCSHIYDSNGFGLQYRLSKIEDAIIRGRNAFLSREDARRIGETVRQLFYESMGRLPRRVVVHRRTRYLPDEIKGFREGLSGVPELDLLEISVDAAMRYVASSIRDGQFQGDHFPVRRGSAVLLEDRRALLWVHGTTEGIHPRKRSYYLGKSRIPAPLTVVRHHGRTELGVLSREILGLSKMNWNTYDLYTKLPATVHSSAQIAEIGMLLERFGSKSYDYRLFI
jgi:hypothetical protein